MEGPCNTAYLSSYQGYPYYIVVSVSIQGVPQLRSHTALHYDSDILHFKFIKTRQSESSCFDIYSVNCRRLTMIIKHIISHIKFFSM